MRGYVDGLIEAQLLVYGYNFIEECVTPELIEAFCKVRPELINFPDSMKVDTKAVIAQHIISVKVAEQERLRYLKVLSEHFNVDLYTGSDTYSMPLIHNRGFAKTNTEMPIIFHQSKINLNLTAKSIRSRKLLTMVLKRLKSTILMISGLLRCWRLRLGLNNITAAGFV